MLKENFARACHLHMLTLFSIRPKFKIKHSTWQQSLHCCRVEQTVYSEHRTWSVFTGLNKMSSNMIQLFAEEMLMVALQPGMPPEFDHLALLWQHRWTNPGKRATRDDFFGHLIPATILGRYPCGRSFPVRLFGIPLWGLRIHESKSSADADWFLWC